MKKLIILLLLCPSVVLGVTKYKDLGYATDDNTSDNVYIEPSIEAYDWYSQWWHTRSGDYAETEIGWFFNTDTGATDSVFNWGYVDTAASVVSARAVKFRQVARVRFDTVGINETNDILWLTIRYKDDLKDSCPVYIYNGTYELIGKIGGGYDHMWETDQFQLLPAERAPTGGEYIVKFASDGYTDDIYGELPLDKIQLATDNGTANFENDTIGYWTTLPTTKFPTIGNDYVYRTGDDPMFLYGTYDQVAQFIHFGDSLNISTDSMDYWQLMEDHHFNCYLLCGEFGRGWYNNWIIHDNINQSWCPNCSTIEAGLTHQITQAVGHGLKIIPNFLQETRVYKINVTYRSDQKLYDTLTSIVADHVDSTVLGWMFVDEWDHEAFDYGKPHMASREFYKIGREQDSLSPNFVSLMGYMEELAWDLVAEVSEVVLCDHYIYGGAGITVAGRLIQQGNRCDTMRGTLPDSIVIAFIPWAGAEHDSAQIDGQNILLDGEIRSVYQHEIIAQAYVTIAHGAKGLVWFRGMHKYNDRQDWTSNPANGYEDAWLGLKQMGEELFITEGGIASTVLDSTIEYMGESSIVTNVRDSVHYAYFARGDSVRMLVSVSGMRDATPTDTFTVTQGLPSGAIVTVMFEDTSFTVNDSMIVYAYANHYDRHVFKWVSEITQTTTCVDTTSSGFSIQNLIFTPYSVACDRAVLWANTSTPLTASDSIAVFADDNLDTLVATGLSANTEYYYRCVAWDVYHADTTDLDSVTTKEAVAEEPVIKILGEGYFRGGSY